uniref:Protein white n=1 Tax=Tigriopus japonicus TaxID=158387 RepID=A0A0A7AS97_TIGJA|nr:ATP-binding cassette transporter sub-family G 75152 [Tigriopus japonicus]
MDEVNFSWKDLTVITDSGLMCRRRARPVLKNVSGYANKGELLAIMGPSSAGKSTLLNALAFQNLNGLQITSGERYANGMLMNPTGMTSISGYIPQFDLFIGTLTVREHLTFLSNLRIGGQVSQEDKRIRVETVMNELGLTKCADVLIGVRGRVKGISGGEMRRLAFASEVLADTPLLLCDEPTSGLDSWMAENVVEQMRIMCDKGKTIICVIHQPSSDVFTMFDRVLLMVEGRNAFMGTIKEANDFFDKIGYPCPSNFNPADHFIYKLSMQPKLEDEYLGRVQYICDEYENSRYGKFVSAEIENHIENREELFHNVGFNFSELKPYKSPWDQQFRAVLWRSWHSVTKEPLIAKIRILEVIVLALIVGAIFFGQENNQEGVISINGALFWVTMNQTFSNYSSVLNVFCNEIPVFIREHFSGMYRTDVYFLAKQIADLPLFVITPVLFMAIYYYMVNLNNEIDRFLMAILINVMIVQTASAIGIFMSCICPNLPVALAIGPTIFIPLMNFGGFFQNEGTIPSYLIWIRYISLYYYGNEAFNINQWSGVTNITCDSDRHESRLFKPLTAIIDPYHAIRRDPAACAETGEEVLDFYHFHKNNLWFDIIMLAILSLSFRILAFLALLNKARRRTK